MNSEEAFERFLEADTLAAHYYYDADECRRHRATWIAAVAWATEAQKQRNLTAIETVRDATEAPIANDYYSGKAAACAEIARRISGDE